MATSMSDQAQPGAVLSLEAYTWRTTRGLILACALWLTSFVMAVELRFVVQRAKKCPYGLAGQWEGGLPAAMDKKDIIYLFIRDMQCIKTGMRVYRYNHIYIIFLNNIYIYILYVCVRRYVDNHTSICMDILVANVCFYTCI